MRKLPPLAALRAFEAAARHESFKLAAAELGVTPTAISHQVRLLEQTCGQELFRRRPRPLTLTAAGRNIYPVLRQGLDAFASAFDALGKVGEEVPLRITTPSAFASHWLVPRLAMWRSAHPDLPLEVIGSDDVLDLRAGDADMGLRYAAAAPTDLPGQVLFRDTFYPMCSPALLEGRGCLARAGELFEYPLIHFAWRRADPAVPDWHSWLAAARSTETDLPDHVGTWELSFREEMHAIDSVLAGQGIAVLSDVVVAAELASGNLVKAYDLGIPGFSYHLVHLQDHPRLPAIATFAAWMQSVN